MCSIGKAVNHDEDDCITGRGGKTGDEVQGVRVKVSWDEKAINRAVTGSRVFRMRLLYLLFDSQGDCSNDTSRGKYLRGVRQTAGQAAFRGHTTHVAHVLVHSEKRSECHPSTQR